MGGIRRSRARGREKGGFHQNAADPSAVDRNGIGSLRKQGSEPEIFSNSLFTGEHRISMSEKASGIPMKMLIDEEVSRDITIRHTSPGIIGRLMGLDAMPSSGVHSQHKYTGSHSQKMSPGSSSDKYGLSEDIPCRRSTDEMPEFKDVFEVMEASRMKLHRSQFRNGNISSAMEKVGNAEMDFIRQKFMDAKRFSTDESLQRSKEFNDALEALVSNKDLLLEFLQEPNTLTANDLPDLSCSPSSNVNRITILKPSGRNKFIDADIIYPPEQDIGSCFHMPKEEKHSLSNPFADFSGQSPREDSSSLRKKLSRSSHQGSIDNKRICPTRIVVLKPCLEKAQNMEGAFPLTHEIFHSSYRRPKACQGVVGIQSPCMEESTWQMPMGDPSALCHRAKGSRELAREIAEQMRRSSRGDGSGKQVLSPKFGTFGSDGQSCFSSSMDKVKTSEAFHRSSELRDAWADPSFGSSPTYQTKKASVSKEAKRRLSDRWKMTHQYQNPSSDANAFSTLGDMLALSDREVSKVSSSSAVCRKCPKGESHRDGMAGSCSYPLGISSNDGWKEEPLSNLTRLKSVSSSPISRGSPKLSSRKRSGKRSEFSMLKDALRVGPCNSEDVHHSRQKRSVIRCPKFHSDEADVTLTGQEENVVTEREIHVNSEEPTYSVAVQETSEERLLHPANSDHELVAECYLNTSSAVPEWQDDTEAPCTPNQLMKQETASAIDHRLVFPSLDSVNQAEGAGHKQGEDNRSPCNPLTELGSPVSSNEDEQPSPVSVLDSSLDAEDGYSGGFEKISADLQELRMQLRLLKMEATDNADETEFLFLSDDEIATSSLPMSEIGETSHAFRDKEERDFSYLLDMLTELGIHAANQDELFNACYFWECPAGTDVYDRLEKKYNKLILWQRPERKLLFDLTNAVLEDMVDSLTQHSSRVTLRRCCSKWGQEGFAEEVWQGVVRQRREMECIQEEVFMDLGWLGNEDGVDLVGYEIGSMLHEDLLEEIIADFLG